MTAISLLAALISASVNNAHSSDLDPEVAGILRLAKECIGSTGGAAAEGKFAEMRRIGQSAFHLLPRFVASDEPASSLAAVALLQDVPSREHLIWLAECVKMREPQILAYQAAVGLRTATDALPLGSLPEAVNAIQIAVMNMPEAETQIHTTLSRALSEAEERLEVGDSYATAFQRAFGEAGATSDRDQALRAWNSLQRIAREPDRVFA